MAKLPLEAPATSPLKEATPPTTSTNTTSTTNTDAAKDEAAKKAAAAKAATTAVIGKIVTPPAKVAMQGDMVAGKTKYDTTCAGCHGPTAGGGVGPALIEPKKWTEAQFVTALRTGKTPARELNAIMPRFSEAMASDKDIANIFAYVKSLN